MPNISRRHSASASSLSCSRAGSGPVALMRTDARTRGARVLLQWADRDARERERGMVRGEPARAALTELDPDYWPPSPNVRVAHRRQSSAGPDDLWQAACTVGLDDSSLLGRLVRWRIPGLGRDLSFDHLFREDPFLVLIDSPEGALVSGLVGRIWTLRRDYPELRDPEEFRQWSAGGTGRVLFANWVEPVASGGAVLYSETRV